MLLWAGSVQAQSRRWALLVGVDDYVKVQKLHYCGADIRALGKQLETSGFPREHVYLLHDEAQKTQYRPVKANIEEQLKLVLGLVEKNDLIVVAFSGHGVHLDGKSYLCPSETDLDNPATMIALDSVYERLDKCPAALKLLLVDACRDDPRLKGQRSLTPQAGTTGLARSLEAPPKGILLLNSCAPGEVSMEDQAFGHGVFMHFVLQALQGAADANGNGRISLLELALYTNDKTKTYVSRQFNGSQRPALKGDLHDDFDLTEAAPREMTNSIGMKLVRIPSGEFLMGSHESAEALKQALAPYQAKVDSLEDEMPRHAVRITRPFYLGACEVTVGQFRRFVEATGYPTDAEKSGRGGWGYDAASGKLQTRGPQYTWRNPGFAQTGDHPVVNVSWNDAMAFCAWLGEKEGKTYRLPTEAQWEYACRAGTAGRYGSGEEPQSLSQIGNVADAAVRAKFPELEALASSDGHLFTAPVGSFRPNALGLFDMHGNVSEWCADWYDKTSYAASPLDDPLGPKSGFFRVLRGGSWSGGPSHTRAANRDGNPPAACSHNTGFRVVLLSD